MKTSDIRLKAKMCENNGKDLPEKELTYNPIAVSTDNVVIDRGTLITLRQIKKSITNVETHLVRRLARRCSVIGPASKFKVKVGAHEICVGDRDYFENFQYLWYFGENSNQLLFKCDATKEAFASALTAYVKQAKLENIDTTLLIDETYKAWDLLVTDGSTATAGKYTLKNETGSLSVYSNEYVAMCGKKLEKHEEIIGAETVDATKGYKIRGWIGTVDEHKDVDDADNGIVITAWGKLVHENLLKELKIGGMYSKYVIGEIQADFFDFDELDDITTSGRQMVKEGDERFTALKTHVQRTILSVLARKWEDWRREHAVKKATRHPAVKKWFETQKGDNKKFAEKLFQKIETLPIPDEARKNELYAHSIVAFETLALKDQLSVIDNISDASGLEVLWKTLGEIDDLEATHYYQISKGRVEILKAFENLVPENKEKVVQKYLFDHLWLLDASWERATTNDAIEKTFKKMFESVKLTTEEANARVDIKYQSSAGKHIIIELKKYDRPMQIGELIRQVGLYREALLKCLTQHGEDDPEYEIICILGSHPTPKNSFKQHRTALAAYGARYITYDELVSENQRRLKGYLDKNKEMGDTMNLITELSPR